MLVVAETPKSASTRPTSASHASGQEQCHALQAHDQGPRSARRWRRVCRAAPPEAFSPQSAGATQQPQQTSMSLWFVSRHTDMEKVPAIVAGTRCFRNFRQTATALLYQFCINQPKIE